MPSDRKPNLIACVAIALTLAPLAAYVGGYYATVTALSVSDGEWVASYYPPGSTLWYEGFHNRARWLFTPIHWLDRKLRRSVWGPGPP